MYFYGNNFEDEFEEDAYDYFDMDSSSEVSSDIAEDFNFRRSPSQSDENSKWVKDWDNIRASETQVLSSSLFTNNFKDYFNQAATSDITLKVGRHSFSCHRLILCAWSEVFSKMLDDPKWNTNCKKTSSTRKTGMFQELMETPECAEVFQDFLLYLYSENIRLNLQNVWPIVLLADKYMVSELRDLCLEFVIKQLDAIALEELWTVVRNGEACLMEDVRAAAMATLRGNLVNLSVKSLVKVNPEEVLELVDSSDVVMEDEYHLFLKIADYLEASEKAANCCSKEMKMKLLGTLRLHQMSASQLSIVSASPFMPAIREAISPNVLEEALMYRALFAEECTGKLPKNVPGPRLYLHNSHYLRYAEHTNNVTYKRALKRPEPITIPAMPVGYNQDVVNVFYIQDGKPFLCQKASLTSSLTSWTYRAVLRDGTGRKSHKRRVIMTFNQVGVAEDFEYKIILQVTDKKGKPSSQRVKVICGVVKKTPEGKYEVKVTAPGYIDAKKGKGLTMHVIIYMYVPPGKSLRPPPSKK